MSDRTRILFVGPSAPDASWNLDAAGFEVRPPVKRGDIASVARAGNPGLLVLVDGLFEQSLAVGHAELRDAMRSGWEIWGLSSMGAIRAYELSTLGMKGYGIVFRMFVNHSDFRDDEVALLHGPAPGYVAASEPLVHIRLAIQDFVRQDWLRETHATDILAELERLWFGHRTLALLAQCLSRCDTPPTLHNERFLRDIFPRYRAKSQDLISFLNEHKHLRH